MRYEVDCKPKWMSEETWGKIQYECIRESHEKFLELYKATTLSSLLKDVTEQNKHEEIKD